MGIIKTIAILIVIAGGGFLYYSKDISPYVPDPRNPSEMGAWKARLEKQREPASFLQLNDSVLAELKEGQPHDPVIPVPSDEVGKDQLFEDPVKGNYHF